MNVFQLKATGPNGICGSRERTITSFPLFTTWEGADRRKQSFKAKCLASYQLAEPVVVSIERLEVID